MYGVVPRKFLCNNQAPLARKIYKVQMYDTRYRTGTARIHACGHCIRLSNTIFRTSQATVIETGSSVTCCRVVHNKSLNICSADIFLYPSGSDIIDFPDKSQRILEDCVR